MHGDAGIAEPCLGTVQLQLLGGILQEALR
jgi:hypothetical protein